MRICIAYRKRIISCSYTRYDLLGRITEVGEKIQTAVDLTGHEYLPEITKDNFLAAGTDGQITQTVYDQAATGSGVASGLSQENLRKRVSASLYRESQGGPVLRASYYNYDAAGNVKTLWQQVDGLGLKKLDYEYDLVSGKVNFVGYQNGQADQFYYRYVYDAENRLVQTSSGTEALVKTYGGSYLLNGQLDAQYEYYLHGPLARTELGGLTGKVQGTDYAYTLQGWLKGVNGQALTPGNEMGNDGITGSTIARDAMGYSLGYYADDYKAIGGSGAAAFPMQWQSQPGDETGQDLYNGNIGNSTVAISQFGNGAPTGYSYRYDQLNRLKETRRHGLTAGTTGWGSGSITDAYKESYSYDANGNILGLLRNGTTEGGKPLSMDNLNYGFNKDVQGKLINNKLRHVKDAVGSGNYTGDIDDQVNDNYAYDAIGNLTKDTQEGITAINWNVYGKIKSIAKSGGNISYTYDASGNRTSKTAGGVTTYYVRDAQGNTLAVYDGAGGNNWKEQQLYGSSRLGMWKPNINIATANGTSVWDSTGRKFFELSNHLGNVLSVITDKRIQHSTDGITVDYYEPDVVSAQDYYPFGMPMPIGKCVWILNELLAFFQPQGSAFWSPLFPARKRQFNTWQFEPGTRDDILWREVFLVLRNK
ncbi:MAG: RHS repeat domain-containing protein [Sphingobacteriaceae bacterium]